MPVRSQLNSSAAKAAANQESSPESAVKETSRAQLFATLAVITLATVVAYSPVLFDFFNGDDFVHLTWLRHAITQPELIWKNFYSSWLDGTTTKFYRPLISVFMVTDYFVWRSNGLGFHLTNLAFHLCSSFLLFGIVRGVVQQLTGRKDDRVALLSAAVFALYPLHPEAVSWITGRVDSIVTTFSLASFWAYLHWRESTKVKWLVLSLFCFALGLISKEMAITVPAVLVLFELLRPNTSFKKLFVTTPFWLVLAGYFVVRRLALGTFVGGYDDSLLFIANFKEFLLNWLHALRMLIIPINKELVGSHNLLTKAWEGLCIGAVALGIWRFATDKNSRRPILFTLGWFALSLLPVYKLFAIADDLQGSRLAYLATVPLSVLFAFALGYFRIHAVLRIALPVGFCTLAAVLLWINNQPWREAGLQANALRHSLQQIYNEEKGDPQTLLIGMPDHHKGAYISRNALWGMTKFPQMKGDIWNCLMLNQFEPVHPFGFLKESLFKDRAQIKVFRWVPADQRFLAVPLKSAHVATTFKLEGPARISSDGKLRPELVFQPITDSCWDLDFVRVDLDLENPGTFPTGADLLYANDINPTFQLGRRTHFDLEPNVRKQSLLFALRSLPEWSFGSSGARLKLLLPPGSTAVIKSITAVPSASVMPQIDFENSGYMGTKGYLHLGADKPQNKLTVDASSVPGATAVDVEITRANLLFEEQNSPKPSTFAREHRPAALKGTIILDKKDFSTPGIYELRAWAKDSSGKLIGRSSDHIVIAVDP